jgi:hypothetical protein
MTDTVEDIEDADTLAETNAVLCNNPGVLEEYERRCKQVHNLQACMKMNVSLCSLHNLSSF